VRTASAAAAALLASLVLTQGAVASPSQESVFMDDARLVYGTDAQVEQTLDVLRSIGVDRVRVSVFWRLLAPQPDATTRPSFDATDPGAYSPAAWDRYDRIVVGALRRGMAPYLTLTGPGPLWASSDPSRGERMWDPSASDFRAFVTAIGRRYSGDWQDERPESPPPPGGLPLPLPLGSPPPPPPPPTMLPRVSFWSAWNEPGQPGWLRPQAQGRVPASPRIYRGLQDAAYSGLRASGHGGDTYLLGETAPRGSSRLRETSPMRPLLFVRELYCLNRKLRTYRGRKAAARGCPTSAAGRSRFASDHPGLFRATGWAHHPYAFEVAPRVRDRNRDQVTISTLPRLTRTLDRALRRYGVRRRLPLWLTEYGYQTDPPDPFLGVSWARQASYLNQAEDIAYRNRRVRSIAQFLLIDDGPDARFAPDDPRYWGSTFQTGLITHDGQHKPSFTAWQRTLAVSPGRVRRGRRLRFLGQLRPAASGASLRAELQFKRRGSRSWQVARRLSTHSTRNYLLAHARARSSGSWRLAWSDPAGAGTLYSRASYVRVTRRRR
jgi:hypothetical protein